MSAQGYATAPGNLPSPPDDGACDHLQGRSLPALGMQSTDGSTVNLSQLTGAVVLFCYPRTGQPGTPLPDGWDSIPGARGCTPQACSYKDKYGELKQHNAQVFGLSTQTSSYQAEAAQRLHLPYPLLSDGDLELSTALKLPTFYVTGIGELIKRLTMIVKDGKIVHCIYPVFPSDSDVRSVLEWLRSNE